ncbi:MAG TPA: hypothetical protein VEY70_18365 [Metabacillus sp.]|nr:hypothetical protein [Metabacillus sp.]
MFAGHVGTGTLSQVLIKIEIVSESKFAIARSNLPSPLKSADTIDTGPPPLEKVPAGENPPVPFPKKTATVSDPRFVTARSGIPSQLISRTVTSLGLVPPLEKGLPDAEANPPAPFPKKTEIEFENSLATARSGIPSPLKSAAVMDWGWDPPVGKGLPIADENPPAPFPKKTETVLEVKSTTARSGIPSPSKSAEVIEIELEPPLKKGLPGAAENPPTPFPKKTEIVLDPR